MFKVRLRFGEIILLVESKEQWNLILEKYGDITVD
jgi:hypothetical protein